MIEARRVGIGAWRVPGRKTWGSRGRAGGQIRGERGAAGMEEAKVDEVDAASHGGLGPAAGI